MKNTGRGLRWKNALKLAVLLVPLAFAAAPSLHGNFLLLRALHKSIWYMSWAAAEITFLKQCTPVSNLGNA